MSLAVTAIFNIDKYIRQMGLPQDALKSKIAVAMSGGVDSSVTAGLLKLSGAKVTGIYMKNWSDPRDCSGAEDRTDALKVAMRFAIPFQIFYF